MASSKAVSSIRRSFCGTIIRHQATNHLVGLCENLSQETLLGCNIYISEARSSIIEEVLKSVANFPTVAVAHVFRDIPYNRTGITLVGNSASLALPASELIMSSLSLVDLSAQVGKHPRIGAVDHVVVHSLLSDKISLAAAAAKNIGEIISSATRVPVFLYGSARSDNKSLDDVRRSLGYFNSCRGIEWHGAEQIMEFSGRIKPDFGPPTIPRKSGCIAVGAVPWVVNYNILINTSDVQFGKQVARAVSERGGGLPRVQAMALVHQGGNVEVACNILSEEQTPRTAVLEFVTRLCREKDVQVLSAYLPGITPELALSKWNAHVSSLSKQQ